MPTYRAGDVLRVPFPYTDRATRQHRPALVVSNQALGADEGLLWVLMITSAENKAWPGDVSLTSTYTQAGLPVPSVIRTVKIATVEARDVSVIGRISSAEFTEVSQQIQAYLRRGGAQTP